MVAKRNLGLIIAALVLMTFTWYVAFWYEPPQTCATFSVFATAPEPILRFIVWVLGFLGAVGILSFWQVKKDGEPKPRI